MITDDQGSHSSCETPLSIQTIQMYWTFGCLLSNLAAFLWCEEVSFLFFFFSISKIFLYKLELQEIINCCDDQNSRFLWTPLCGFVRS